jgi:hypothetical protein
MPWGALADLGEGVALELSGGASFSFTHRLQASLALGEYNVLAQPAWSRFVPGTFAEAELAAWFD